ncbi:MAG: hypothetical protein ACR2O4_06695, partial [Hyphomicrobiaceae bacterium]
AHGFAELLGVLINLKDGRIQAEEHWHQHLLSDPANNCFETVIPRRAYLQRAADFEPGMRTFMAKYPGDAGSSIVGFVNEMLERIRNAELERAASATAGTVVHQPQQVQPAPQPAPVASEPVTTEPEAPQQGGAAIVDPWDPAHDPVAPGKGGERSQQSGEQVHRYEETSESGGAGTARDDDRLVAAPDPNMISGTTPPPPRPRARTYGK